MFLTGHLLLRGFDPETDNKIWLQWTNDEAFLETLSEQGPQPWSREKSEDVLDKRAKDKDALPWFMICDKPKIDSELPSALVPNDDYFRTADSKARYPAIGILTMNRVVMFGIMLNESHRKKGLGTEVLRWMCEYVFATLGFHRIELSADTTNARAINCYQKVGFVEKGRRHKRFWRQGTWRDVLEMVMLEEEWFEKRRPRDAELLTY